ncbi:MAG: ATP-binding protein [Caldilineaceae bacterium]|nr:ATP-binding protein [Caldilineaceae bacterium]
MGEELSQLGRPLPDVVDYQVSQVGSYLVTSLTHEVSEDRALFDLAKESDGTLRMLGILSALYQDPPLNLVALEEPEMTIHPGALRLLWEQIEFIGSTGASLASHPVTRAALSQAHPRLGSPLPAICRWR